MMWGNAIINIQLRRYGFEAAKGSLTQEGNGESGGETVIRMRL